MSFEQTGISIPSRPQTQDSRFSGLQNQERGYRGGDRGGRYVGICHVVYAAEDGISIGAFCT